LGLLKKWRDAYMEKHKLIMVFQLILAFQIGNNNTIQCNSYLVDTEKYFKVITEGFKIKYLVVTI